MEIAPTQPLVLNVLSFAFLGSMATANTIEARSAFAHKVEQVLADLVRSYTGTDGVTLLDFLADFLRRLDDHVSRSKQYNYRECIGQGEKHRDTNKRPHKTSSFFPATRLGFPLLWVTFAT